MYIYIEKAEEICGNCKNFYQHYVRTEGCGWEFTPCNAGHCCYPRLKGRKPCDTCSQFKVKESIKLNELKSVKN